MIGHDTHFAQHTRYVNVYKPIVLISLARRSMSTSAGSKRGTSYGFDVHAIPPRSKREVSPRAKPPNYD